MALRSPLAPISPFSFNPSPLPQLANSRSKSSTTSISTSFPQTLSISNLASIPSLLSCDSLQELLANPINFVRGKNIEKRPLEDDVLEGSNKRPRVKYNIKEYYLKFMPARGATRATKSMDLCNGNITDSETMAQDRNDIRSLPNGEGRVTAGMNKLEKSTSPIPSVEMASNIAKKKEENSIVEVEQYPYGMQENDSGEQTTHASAGIEAICKKYTKNISELEGKIGKHFTKDDKVDSDVSNDNALSLQGKRASSPSFPEAASPQLEERVSGEETKKSKDKGKDLQPDCIAPASPGGRLHGQNNIIKQKEMASSSNTKTTSSLKRIHEEDEENVGPLAKKQDRTPRSNLDTIVSKSSVSSVPTQFWNGFPENQYKEKRAKGIHNGGLWCYRNASIQALLHVPALYDFFVNRHTSCKLKNCISCELHEFATVHYSSSSKGLSATNERLASLQKIDNMLGGPFAKRKNHQQQDADEYTTLLLDKAIEQLKNGDKKKRTALEEILEVVIVQSVLCTNCKHRSVTRTRGPTMRLQFPTGVYKPANLERLIGDLEQQCKIPDYKCEKCGHKGAVMRRRFAELPSSLLIHVNRGGVLDGAIGRGRFSLGTRKIAAHLNFKTEMALETANGSTQKYQLRSLVSHAGSSLHGGHYVSFVRNPSGETWSFCNDANVTPRDERKVLNDQNYYNPYILFYSKKSP